MNSGPDFSEYSYEELLDVESSIDKEKFPDRYEKIAKLLNDPDRKAEASECFELYKYSTFWPRAGAAMIDGLIFLLIFYIECLIFGVEFNIHNQYFQAINGVQIAIYTIIMHGYFGQTFGKMYMNVKVLNHSTETDIGIKQALRRESVNLLLNISSVIVLLLVTKSLEVTGTISLGLSYSVIGFGLLAGVWVISEFITMLFNDKRRALHDLIGKTIVVRT